MRVTLFFEQCEQSNISVAAQAPVERALFDQARVLTTVCLPVVGMDYWELTCTMTTPTTWCRPQRHESRAIV